jgi:hypothetical protein
MRQEQKCMRKKTNGNAEMLGEILIKIPGDNEK